MGTRRSSYLRLITRSDGGSLPVMRPPNPLLRRWEMTAGVLPSERPTTNPEPARITDAVSRPPVPPPKFTSPDHESQAEPANIANSTQSVVEEKRTSSTEEAAVKVSSMEPLRNDPVVEARTGPETKNPVNQMPEAQVTSARVAPVTPGPNKEPSVTSQRPGPTTEPMLPSEIMLLPTTVVTSLPSPLRRNTEDASPRSETGPIKSLSQRPGAEVSNTTGPQPLADKPMRSAFSAGQAPASLPRPTGVAAALRPRRDIAPATNAPAVHIGSVEVRIVPPAAPPNKPPRAAAGSSSTALLSRGFTTSFGLRQG